MQAPAAILWDWDNTLADNWASMTAAMNAAFRDFDLPEWTEAQMRGGAKLSIRDAFPTLFGPDWKRARDIFLHSFDSIHLDGLRAMPGAAAVLQAVAHLPQAIVSNKSGAPLRKEVTRLGWDGYFGAIIGADDAAHAKPHPAPLWHALELIGVKSGTCVWYIGDTGVDMQAAHASCCTAILIGDATHDGGPAGIAAQGWGPHLHLTDLTELEIVLRRLAPAER